MVKEQGGKTAYLRGQWTWVLLIMLAALSGCATLPPSNVDDACKIFEEKRSWYRQTMRSYKKWGVPVHVQMAIMHQESRFKADARPPREKLLWFIPWFRKSSAFGYAQVKDETWDWYVKKTGNMFADRDDFADAVDFIGWYGSVSSKELGVSKWDAYSQYLAYHEGHGGFKRKTYLDKAWLVEVARKVKKRSENYAAQLKQCQYRLNNRWNFWPF